MAAERLGSLGSRPGEQASVKALISGGTVYLCSMLLRVGGGQGGRRGRGGGGEVLLVLCRVSTPQWIGRKLSCGGGHMGAGLRPWSVRVTSEADTRCSEARVAFLGPGSQ